MIAALDVYVFISSTVDDVHRNIISAEGTKGKASSTYFEEWIECHLYPALGNHAKGEARSIVVMGSASIHVYDRTMYLIRNTYDYVLCVSPCSPYLNPIENAFNMHK